MKILESNTSINVYEAFEELKMSDREIFTEARKQVEIAYAPYSKFRVGAALRLVNGKIICGSNQENASYSLCMCAERVALYNAATHFPDIPIREIAIVAKGTVPVKDMPVTPCGACRQVICEFENRHNHPIRLIMEGWNEFYEVQSAKDLLAFSFDQRFLLGS